MLWQGHHVLSGGVSHDAVQHTDVERLEAHLSSGPILSALETAKGSSRTASLEHISLFMLGLRIWDRPLHSPGSDPLDPVKHFQQGRLTRTVRTNQNR